jgi:cell fate regulator YaaT (PSP1 superfamily)
MEDNSIQHIPHNKPVAVTPEEIEKKIKSSSKRSGSSKLYCYNWLQDIKHIPATHNLVEIRFKNTRKDFYENNLKLSLEVGDIVAVEASPGHDIGIVSLTGELVLEQLRKVYGTKVPETFPKIYRKAKPNDIEKWEEAKALEHKTMIKSRQIAKDLKLQMKIGDVEYQGDKTKAIFYYIADERVDFRELIKILAEQFRIRVEMRQIGARQEAGRIGGIGPCGRDLCCSSFVSNFVSVSTTSARYQEISLNPQKLAGQCGKLKCCLNYELASYMDARKDFPDTTIALEFSDVKATHAKTDVYKRIMWYFFKKDEIPHFLELTVDQIHEIIDLNKKGIKPERPEQIASQSKAKVDVSFDYTNVVGQESLTRFDKQKNQKNRPNQNQQKNQGNNQQQKQTQHNQSEQVQNKQGNTQNKQQNNNKQQFNKHKQKPNQQNNNGQKPQESN